MNLQTDDPATPLSAALDERQQRRLATFVAAVGQPDTSTPAALDDLPAPDAPLVTARPVAPGPPASDSAARADVPSLVLAAAGTAATPREQFSSLLAQATRLIAPAWPVALAILAPFTAGFAATFGAVFLALVVVQHALV